MKIKYKIILVVLGTLLISSLVLGTSYAMWIFTAVQENTNVVSTDCFDITLSDFNNITLNNAMPISDSDAMSLIPYTFTIKNICNHAANYDVNIETLSGSTLDINYLRYKLDNKDSNILGNKQDVSSSNFVNDNAIKSNTIFSNILESNEEKTFNLRLWIDEAATVDETASKYYSSKVVVRASLNAHYSSTTLISGMEFNEDINYLVDPIYEPDFNNVDGTIKNILFADSMPDENVKKINVSVSEEKPVYAWFDNDTIYLYSDCEKIYLNSNSESMFTNMQNLQTLDLSMFDTSKVINMNGMFSDMLSLQSLNLSSFDTSNVTDMSYMFYGCINLEKIYVSNMWNNDNVTNFNEIFASNYKLVGGQGTAFDDSNDAKEYARVDDPDNGKPGYFTLKNN